MKKYIFCLLALTLYLSPRAQSKVLISGTVTDATDNSGLSFATVSLKDHLIGIVTNESGRFDLYVPEDMMDDMLMVSYFGYKTQLIPLRSLQSPVSIRLQQSAVDLNEIVVKPQPPEFYIKQAILFIKANYPTTPFVNVGYYREKVLENKNFIKCDEGIFKTYCQNYLDTVKNQDQLLLYRQEKDIREMQFMLKERKEQEEKERRRVEKENAKSRKKGKPETAKVNNDNIGADLAESFGGPQEILRQGNIARHPDGFLDTNKFDDYKYSFAKSSSYNNSELMVIDFKSKGKVDHMRSTGKIYLDATSHAFVKIEFSGDFVIPVYIRPVLFFAGYGIDNPTFSSTVEFQQVRSKWYPKNIHYDIRVGITKKHMFSKNDHSDFVIEGVYTVNQLKIDNVSPIPAAKRFKPSKPMKEQVHNDEGITWEGVNIIKK